MSAAGRAGFTLLEMLVILAILALVTGIAFPALDKAMRRQAFAEATARVETMLREARARAIGEGAAVRLRAGPGGHALAAGMRVERLPDTAVVRLPSAGLAFFPDGSATGGRVDLVDGRLGAHWQVRAATAGIGRVP